MSKNISKIKKMFYSIKGNIWSNKMMKITLEYTNKLSLEITKFFATPNIFSLIEKTNLF